MTVSSPTDPASGKTARPRYKRRVLLAVVGLGLCIPVAALVAPLQSKRLAAVGLEQAYGWFDQPAVDFGPPPGGGLSVEQIQSQLGAGYEVRFEQKEVPPERDLFGYENPLHPEVEKFRQETVDLVPEPFDVLEVSRRVRALSRHTRKPGYAGDSSDVRGCLAAARNNVGLWCHHFSRIFGGLCSAHGYPNRIVSLSETGDLFGHAMCEVYLPEHDKWVAIDTDFEVTYWRDGVWLNAYELHMTWRDVCEQLCPGGDLQQRYKVMRANKDKVKEIANLEIVPFGHSEPALRDYALDDSVTGLHLEYFEHMFLARRDDYLSREYPFGHPLRVRQLAFRADGQSHLTEVGPDAIYLSAEVAYAPINTSWINVVEVRGPTELVLSGSTYTPGFDRFELRRNGEAWESVPGRGASIRVQLKPGRNEFELRAVNGFGVRSGEPARLIVIAP